MLTCVQVLFAIGRDPDTRALDLDKAGVKMDSKYVHVCVCGEYGWEYVFLCS